MCALSENSTYFVLLERLCTGLEYLIMIRVQRLMCCQIRVIMRNDLGVICVVQNSVVICVCSVVILFYLVYLNTDVPTVLFVVKQYP